MSKYGDAVALSNFLKDVEDAQNAVVVLAKELSNSGQIVISEGKEDGEMVY